MIRFKRWACVRKLRAYLQLHELNRRLETLVAPQALFGIEPSSGVKHLIDQNNRKWARLERVIHRKVD